jgi:hypothetical protein
MLETNKDFFQQVLQYACTQNFCEVVVTPLINLLQKRIRNNLHIHDWLRKRAILATNNGIFITINARIIRMFPAGSRIYASVDSFSDKSQVMLFATKV